MFGFCVVAPTGFERLFESGRSPLEEQVVTRPQRKPGLASINPDSIVNQLNHPARLIALRTARALLNSSRTSGHTSALQRSVNMARMRSEIRSQGCCQPRLAPVDVAGTYDGVRAGVKHAEFGIAHETLSRRSAHRVFGKHKNNS